MIVQLFNFCKKLVISSISLLVVLSVSLRAIVSFFNRWPGGSIVSSVAMDWALGLMYLGSCLNLCSMRITVECGVIVAVYELLSTGTILGEGEC